MKLSVILPCYKRVDQTKVTIEKLFTSLAYAKDIEYEVIVSDSTPENVLEHAVKEAFGEKIIYVRPENPGIASGKNKGAKVATGKILIFCDSDMEVEETTIQETVTFLSEHPSAGAVGGQVLWKTGPHDGSRDRPRPEDRIEKIDGTDYCEALYSRYFVTYKDIFWNVGGYDENVFNMRGEGSDLSIRYWRAGFPLTYDERIVVHHVYDAPDSIALRIENPLVSIAKDLYLLGYKYDCYGDLESNFAKTVEANFKPLGDKGYSTLLQGIGQNYEFITKAKPFIDEEKKRVPAYPFKFLEVFSQHDLFTSCIQDAEKRIHSIVR